MGKDNMFWIKGMRIFAWIVFAATVIVGGGLVPVVTETPISIILTLPLSLIVGFLIVAGIMIFLDMATDIKEMRISLSRQDTDES